MKKLTRDQMVKHLYYELEEMGERFPDEYCIIKKFLDDNILR